MHLEKLPRGITGFFGRHSQIERIDPKQFKAAGYHAAVRTNGSVEIFDANLLGRNYYALTMRSPSYHMSVLCNAVCPVVGFVCAGAYGFTTLTFVDGGAVARVLAEIAGFQVIDVDLLTADLEQTHIADLASEELEQLRYWQRERLASRVGDVIFNAWD